jgi:predicted phage terminase large subunit-like protein
MNKPYEPQEIRLTPLQYRALLVQDLSSFIARSFAELNPGTTYLPNWHIDLIADRLMQVYHRRIKRLIINIPPRNLKSICASVAFPAWALGRDPSLKFICSSYSSELADKLARDTQMVMNAPFYREIFPGTQLSGNRRAAHDFTTTAHGYRYAVSAGGSLTGRGADFLIIDDPLKPDEATSEAQRTAINDWFDGTALSRLDNKQEGAIVIIMQRLHLDDLVGHVLAKGGDWEVLNLPAIAEDEVTHEFSTLLGKQSVTRQVGSVLHVAREPLKTLEELRGRMGDYVFAGQYQQSPVPLGGAIIKDAWVQYYAREELPQKFDLLVQSWDTASKTSESAAYSVCVTIGIKNQKAYIVDVFRKRMEFPTLKAEAIRLYQRYKPHFILVEDKSSGTQLIQEMKDVQMYGVKAVKPNGDKETRLIRHSVKFESGRVKLPQRAHWLHEFKLELTSFPSSRFADQVDATTQALDYLQERMDEPGLLAYYRMEYEKRERGES